MSPRLTIWRIWLIPLVILLLSIFVIESNIRQGQQDRVNAGIERLAADSNSLRAQLERDLNNATAFSRGLDSFIISQNGELDVVDLRAWLANMYVQTGYMINIGIAPGNTIEVIFPEQGNEAALGLYYPSLASQWPAIEAIIASRRPAMVGPINLVQGGLGLIYRSPIYINNEYWGITSIVMDSNKLLSVIDDQQRHPGTVVALLDGDKLIYGDQLAGDDIISRREPLSVSGTNWTLLTQRKLDDFGRAQGIRWASYPISLIAFVLLLLLFSSRNRSRLQTLALREENDRIQKEFVAIVSHELRTPLTALQGSLALLSNSHDNMSASEKQLLEISRRNVGYLGILINNLLDLDRLSRSELVLQQANLAIEPLAAFVINMMTHEATAKNISIHLMATKTPKQIFADADRVQQILHQLLSNAIKFSPDNTQVLVQITNINQKVRIKVSDQGPGIDKDVQDIMFRRFHQGHQGEARRSEGVGIGLALVYELTQLMGGELNFQTGDHGTTFEIDFPAEA